MGPSAIAKTLKIGRASVYRALENLRPREIFDFALFRPQNAGEQPYMLAITSGIASRTIERTNQSASRLIKASIIAASLPNVDVDQIEFFCEAAGALGQDDLREHASRRMAVATP